MIIDILVVVILLISALIAFLRGFIREVLTIAGVVGGLAAAYFGGPYLIPHMRGWFGVEKGVVPDRLFGILPYDILADALSYGGIFILVVILLSVLSHFLAETARNIGLGAVDRTLGFVFGLVRGVLLIGLLYLPVHLFIEDDAKESWFKDSRTHFYMVRVADAFAQLLPENAVEETDEALEKLEEDINEASQTRKKLEEINLLKADDKDAGRDNNNDAPSTSPNGYSDEFRDKMDQLFEDETTDETP